MLNYSANGPSGYNLTNSLRFRSSANATLTRTPTSASNRTTWTTSFWFKRGALSSSVPFELFVAFNDTSNHNRFFFDNSTNILTFQNVVAGTASANLITTQVFRDPSAWYHIVVVWDTTQATASNRVKIYINGSQITSFSTATYPPQNQNSWINGVYGHTFGSIGSFNWNYDGYLAEWNFIDGQALTPSSFGSTNSTTGVWQPAKYTGTYGTNGFYLPFTSSYFGFPLSSTTGPGFSTYYASFINGTSGNQVNLPANATNLAIGTGDFTIEGWVNTSTNGRGSLIGIGAVNATGSLWFGWENNTTSYIRFGATDVISSGLSLSSAGWVHIALTRSGSTVRLYKNGSLVASGTSSTNLNLTDVSAIGSYGGTSPNAYTLQGSISNLRLVVGTALYTGSTYTVPTSALTAVSGTQLLTLQDSTLKDNSANNYTMTATINYVLDASGNNNNWTPNNINFTTTGITYDLMKDVPTLTSATTANYSVLNPLALWASPYASPTYKATLVFGNLVATYNGTNFGWAQSSMYMPPSSNKYYFEATYQTSSNSGWFGIFAMESGIPVFGWNYEPNGAINSSSGSIGSFSSYTQNDIVSLAVDRINNTISFYKNNTLQTTISTSAYSTYSFAGACWIQSNLDIYYFNFGQQGFAYTPPTGHVALNTYNLPTNTIVQGNKYMDVGLVTGSATVDQTITTNFAPNFVWSKCRNAAIDHALYDTTRGGTKYLSSNTTTAETTSVPNTVTFNSNGITLKAGGSLINDASRTYVDWMWLAGSSTSSNTSGSITSTVSVNTTAGFSVVTYTGTGANATVGHGLGVAPKMVIVKQRNTTRSWYVYHGSLTSAANYLVLDSTAAAGSDTTLWNNTAPTSSVFSLGANIGGNQSTGTYVAYCWSAIPGFSAFGSYTGNANASGPFIYCGFQPKFIMFKRSDAIENWGIWTPLAGGNGIASSNNFYILPNSSGAQDTTQIIDILSNGFKIRDSGSFDNANNGTYIYAAFASNPFKNSNAF